VTISPFLGLLGTVWGIMTSFWDMASMQSANLTVVAPGIAEALVTTIAGLATAIPAVIFYNMLVRKIDLVGNEMDRLRTILEERLPAAAVAETWAGRDVARRPERHDTGADLMRRGSFPQAWPDINITSLVDVTLCLLIIFMLTAPYIQGGVEVNLPEAEPPAPPWSRRGR
jgi:hypothetical protein